MASQPDNTPPRNPPASSPTPREDAARRVYVAPELVEYGSVAKLTQGGGMTATDFFYGLRRMG